MKPSSILKRAEHGQKSEGTRHSILLSNTDRSKTISNQYDMQNERNLQAEAKYGFGVSIPRKAKKRDPKNYYATKIDI